MDRYISDEQLDGAIHTFLVERGDEVVAIARSTHRAAASGMPRAGLARPFALASLVTLLVALLAGAGVLVGGQLLRTDRVSPPHGKFTPAGSLPEVREDSFTATGLPDGRVLVIGGCHPCAVAQLWDPMTLAFTPAGALPEGRELHTATLLPDGRVLVLGGYGGRDWKTTPSGPTAAELWDPQTLSFSSAGTHAGIAEQTATLLPDGRVLIGDEATFELWDPVDLSFQPAGTLLLDIAEYTATGLPDGRVLIVGGFARFAGGGPSAIAEVWDSRTKSFSPTGSLAQARRGHTATLLADGRVLIVGGDSWDGTTSYTLASAEVWDPTTDAFSPAGTLAESRDGHTATLLPDGRVLIAGGTSGQQTGPDGEWRDLASAELWDPSTEAFDPAGSLGVARAGHAASLLPDGRVLIVGGEGRSGDLGAATASSGLPERRPNVTHRDGPPLRRPVERSALMSTVVHRLARPGIPAGIFAITLAVVVGAGGTEASSPPTASMEVGSMLPTGCPAGAPLKSGDIATIAGTGIAGHSGDDGQATEATVDPNAITVDADGVVYLSQGTSIRRIDGDGLISTFVGPQSGGTFVFPIGLAFDAAGDLLVADPGNLRTSYIWKIDPAGKVIPVAGKGVFGSTGNDGPALDAEIEAAMVTVGPRGDLYFDDQNGFRTVDTAGLIHAFAGTGVAGFSGDDGQALEATIGLSDPVTLGVAADGAGNVYLGDPSNHRIRKVDTAGVITTVAGTGIAGYSGDQGPAVDATIDSPGQLVVDAAGNVFFVDVGTIRRIDTAGVITTVAGTGVAGFSGDCGPAVAAQVAPTGVAVHDGIVYIGDEGNFRIRMIVP